MKKLLLSIGLLIGTATLWAGPVHLKRARQIARKYMQISSDECMLTPLSVSLVPDGTNEIKAAEEEDDCQPLYIFDRGNDKGFVVVAGDDRLPEIIGYAERGSFREQEMPPALLDMLTYYTRCVEEFQRRPEIPALDNTAMLVSAANARAGRESIAPLIETHWAQGWPYNNRCPLITGTNNRSLTGCTATALSQALYYWRKDLNTRTHYSTPTYSYGAAPVTESVPEGTPIKWELMKTSYSNSSSAESCEAVATLIYVVGTSIWQTYGSSTSGNLYKFPENMPGQMDMSFTYMYKGNYEESTWENLIYNELSARRPIVYAGQHPTDGGHAIVLDGYSGSDNLFHFNFGWGGQGDGYYTLTNPGGINGFAGGQEMVCMRPRKQNIHAEISVNDVIQTVAAPVRITVTNEATLNVQGIYLFCVASARKPTSLQSAAAYDDLTKISPEETRSFDFEITAPMSRNYTLYVTDKDLNVLAEKSIDVKACIPDIALQKVSLKQRVSEQYERISIGENTEEIAVQQLYNTDATILLQVRNADDGGICQPKIRCKLMKYDVENKAFVQTKQLSVLGNRFASGESQDVGFDFMSLQEGGLYKASVEPKLQNNFSYTIDLETPDSVIYFRVHAPELTIENKTAEEMVFSGTWNEDVFAQLATDTRVSRYDLTNVRLLNTQPKAVNPNALYYVSEEAMVKGKNIIQNGVCEKLVLQEGYNFCPRENFKALTADFTCSFRSGMWQTLILPFEAVVPSGMMARRVIDVEGMYITECDNANERIECGVPYLIRVSTDKHNRLSASDVIVSTTKSEQEAGNALLGTYQSILATEGMCILNSDENQYFVPAADTDIVPAFTAVLLSSQAVRANSSSYLTKDKSTLLLAQSLQKAYGVREDAQGAYGIEADQQLCTALKQAEQAFTQQPDNAELVSQRKQIEEAVNDYLNHPKSLGDGSVDYTTYIVNPSFESGNTTGWTIDKSTNASGRVINTSLSDALFVKGTRGNYIFTTTLNNGATVGLSQTITGLPNGRYRVAAKVTVDEGKEVVLFAGDAEAPIIGDDFGNSYFQEAVVDGVQVTDGMLTIGIEAGGSVYKVDDFRLTYLDGTSVGVKSFKAQTNQKLQVESFNGGIRITTEQPTEIRVMTLHGIQILNRVVNGTTYINGLASGVYIINKQKIWVP